MKVGLNVVVPSDLQFLINLSEVSVSQRGTSKHAEQVSM